MLINFLVIISLSFSAPSDFDTSLSIESLIKKLSSETEQDHAIARQLLSYKHPLEVLPKILPYLSSPNADINGTAKNILFDLANECKNWGDDVRKKFCEILIDNFTNDAFPSVAKGDILKALVFAVNEEVDLSPLKRFLFTEEWREKVRYALVESNTTSAKQLLCDSLREADDNLKVNILLGLYQLNSVPCEDTLDTLLSSQNSAVKASASLVLSNSSSPIYAEKLFNLCINEPEISDFYAQNWDALLKITENIVKSGGNWSYAMEMYKKIISNCRHQPTINSAIISIGRYGDDSSAEFLSSLVFQQSGEIKKSALYALTLIQNEAVLTKALELCDYLSIEEQSCILPLLIKGKTTPETTEIVHKIIKSGFGKKKFLYSFWEFPECHYLDFIPDIIETLSDDEKSLLTQSLWKYVSINPEDQSPDCFGKAYLYLYKILPPDEKQYVVTALKKYKLPGLSPELISELLKEDITSLPFPILYELYYTLPENSDNKPNLYSVILKYIKNAHSVESLISSIAGSKYLSNFPKLAGFITKWSIVGPFPWHYEDGINADFWIINSIDKKEEIVYQGEKFSWETLETEGWGYINLMKLCEGKSIDCSNLCAFGLARISVEKPIEAFVLLGSDDGFGLWINREKFFAKNADRGMKPDEDKIPITLKQGINEIAVLITQIKGGWNFCLRLVDCENKPIKFSIEEGISIEEGN